MFIIDITTTKQDFLDNVFTLSTGSVFKYDNETILFETVVGLIGRYKPDEIIYFEVQYITPGTELYTVYGHSSIIVIANSSISSENVPEFYNTKD